MSERYFRLSERHQRIDAALVQELRRPRPDAFRIVELKKMKLQVKDLLNRLMRKRQPV